jgi:hypothetical protein
MLNHFKVFNTMETSVLSLLLLYYIIIVILIVLPLQIGSPIYASLSPSFSLHEIRDDTNNQNNDRVSLVLTKEKNNITLDYPDIQLVDYLSDGRFFNATIWFASPANTTLTCAMFIDADSNSETGYGGMEYEMMVTGDVHNREKVGIWKQVLIEHSSTFDYFRTIREGKYLGVISDSTYSKFNEPNSRYCTLSLDLSAINFPDNYRVLFYTHTVTEKAIDFTNWVDIPPTHFSVITNPNPLVLRPDDDQTVPVQVKSSSTPVNSIINLTLSNNNNNRSSSGESDKPIISIEKIPHPVLTIKIPKNALGVYQIPLKVTVSTESLVPKEPTNPSNMTGNTTGKRYEISSLYPARGYITGPTNLTLTVLQPLDWTQKFKAFWDVFGQPISIIAGGFAGGATSLLFDRFKVSKKTKK